MFPPGGRNKLVRSSKEVGQAVPLSFSIVSLGNLYTRTKLAIATAILGFTEYGDFAEYLGPRWHYYLGAAIDAIPVTLKMTRVDFLRGPAGKLLMNEYVKDPEQWMDEQEKGQFRAACCELGRKFLELCFDERGGDARPALGTEDSGEADNIDFGPVEMMINGLDAAPRPENEPF